MLLRLSAPTLFAQTTARWQVSGIASVPPIRRWTSQFRVAQVKVALIFDCDVRSQLALIFLRSALQAGALSPFLRVGWDRRRRVPLRSAS